MFDTIEHMCYSVNDETAHIVCSSIYNTHCLLDEQMHYIMQNMRSRLFDRTNTGIGGIFMAKGKISAKQEEILEYIKAQTLQRGYPPAVREICDAVHLKSTSSVHSHLETLEKNGYIRRDPTKPRAIEIIDDEFNLARREIVNVPVIGEIAAGEPIFAEQNIEGYFPLLPEDVPTGESFMLKVRGESMINVGIYDGDKILVKKDIQSDLSKELFAVLKGTLIPVQRVPVERINRVTRKNHQGVIAFISSVTYQKTEDLVPFLFEQGKNPLFVMLDGITDVRNFGAIARTCECAAVDAVIIPARNSVSVNADAMKTSAGALHTLPVCREHSLKETLQFLKNSGFHIVAATEKGDYDYTKADYTGPMCIIMGAEDKGVSYDNLALCDEWVKIPMLGTIESLNVSVAAGILIYEAVKQRTN